MRTNISVVVSAMVLVLLCTCPNVLARFFPDVSAIPSTLLPNATAGGAWDAFRQFAGFHPGEHHSGLDKLKNYFHHFGYIPDSVSNFTDDFDEELESALRTYQRNFNLNVTGELDDETIKQILRPRCGNADIVNGSTTMNSGKMKSSSSVLGHTVAHYAFFPGKPRWPQSRRDLTYAFWPGNQLGDDVKSVFARAFQRWSTVIPMNFTETGAYTSADIRIGFFSGDHGDGEPFDGVLGTLAHAFSPPSGRFHLDMDENWVVSGDISNSALPSAVDLESVAVHEIGHLLGLGHSSVEEAIMYPTISSRTKKVELANDDILGIQELYGTNPTYDSSSSPSTQQNDTSGTTSAHSRWGHSAFLAVGFLFLLL